MIPLLLDLQTLGVSDCWGCVPSHLWTCQKMDSHLQAPPGEASPARGQRYWPLVYSISTAYVEFVCYCAVQRSLHSFRHPEGLQNTALALLQPKMCVCQ